MDGGRNGTATAIGEVTGPGQARWHRQPGGCGIHRRKIRESATLPPKLAPCSPTLPAAGLWRSGDPKTEVAGRGGVGAALASGDRGWGKPLLGQGQMSTPIGIARLHISPTLLPHS